MKLELLSVWTVPETVETLEMLSAAALSLNRTGDVSNSLSDAFSHFLLS
jgi:hypothetical protein